MAIDLVGKWNAALNGYGSSFSDKEFGDAFAEIRLAILHAAGVLTKI
jgi:hypothetical protein